jgi:hypothetical protein
MELGGGPVKTSVRQFKCIFGEGQVAINELFNDCKKAMDGMIHSNHGTNLLNQPIEPTKYQIPSKSIFICIFVCEDVLIKYFCPERYIFSVICCFG